MTSIGPIQLFGRAVSVTVDASAAGGRLADELALYPPTDARVAQTVRVTHERPPLAGLANPSLHLELADGFAARYPNATVVYRIGAAGVSGADVHLPPANGGVAAWRSRWRSIQYATSEESIGQLFHELVAVPLLYFEADHMPIHAAGFDVPGVGMTLVGGTGGVGKTTLAVDLCLRHGAAFAADDIAVVDADGAVHPNLAYPKIYGYNLAGDPELRERVMGSARRTDRLQWRWRVRRRGPALVRRRVSPVALYGSVVPRPAPLRRYVVLVREHRGAVHAEPLAAAAAAEMSTSVLRAEYEIFHRHLSWHAFNALAAGREPVVRLDERFAGWREHAQHLLDNVERLLIRIPVGASHASLRRQLAGIVASG